MIKYILFYNSIIYFINLTNRYLIPWDYPFCQGPLFCFLANCCYGNFSIFVVSLFYVFYSSCIREHWLISLDFDISISIRQWSTHWGRHPAEMIQVLWNFRIFLSFFLFCFLSFHYKYCIWTQISEISHLWSPAN